MQLSWGFFVAESQAETVKYSALLSPLLLLSPRKLCYYVQYQNQQDFQGGKSSQVAAGNHPKGEKKEESLQEERGWEELCTS